MKPFNTIRNFFRNISHMKEGIDNQSSLLNDKLIEVIDGIKNQTRVINYHLVKQIDLLEERLVLLENGHNIKLASSSRPKNFEEVLKNKPLMFAPKTFNTSHPDYDARKVRNFPG